MDILLKRLRDSDCGLHVRGTYMGAAVHADDLRTTAESTEAILEQNNVIHQFATDACLRLNSNKAEIVRISSSAHEDSVVVQLGNCSLPTVNAAKCLGVWWCSSLSAKNSVTENISKARRETSLQKKGYNEPKGVLISRYRQCVRNFNLLMVGLVSFKGT